MLVTPTKRNAVNDQEAVHIDIRRWFVALAVIYGLAGGYAAREATAITYRTVALTGQQVPGAATGETFSTFGNFVISSYEPVINNSGQVSFAARLNCPCFGTATGLWSEAGGILKLVAREGAPTPDSTPRTFTSFEKPNGFQQQAFNDLGQVAFHTGGAPFNASIWSEGTGSLQLITKIGSAAPGAGAGVNFTSFWPPVLNNVGQVAFKGYIGNGSGIWAERNGGLQLITGTGASAPGAGAGVKFNSFGSPAFNSAAQSAFFARLTDHRRGIWSEGGGSLHLVAREGLAAPGMATGTTFGTGSFGDGAPAFNDAGQTAFRALVRGPGPDDSSQDSVWSEGGGTLHLVARRGMNAPGANAHFDGFSPPLLNAAGEIAFRASLAGEGVDQFDHGIWAEDDGSLRLVARTGMDAPGTAGLKFFGFGEGIAFNDVGHAAFVAYIGADSNQPYRTSIWAEGPNGLTLIAQTGALLELAAGDFRTMTNIGVAFNADDFDGGGNQDGRPRAFNNRGELVFRSGFYDDVRGPTFGIFVADVDAVPEPTSWGTCVVGIVSLSICFNRARGSCCCRRRRRAASGGHRQAFG